MMKIFIFWWEAYFVPSEQFLFIFIETTRFIEDFILPSEFDCIIVHILQR